MALADLLRAFERDTQAEIAAILARGDADAARIADAASVVRAERVAIATEQLAAERHAAADTEIARAQGRARAETLAARATMLDRIRAAVAAALPARIAADPALGAKLIAAALACAGDEPGTLRCTPVLLDAARATAPPAIRVESDPAVATGVVLELASGVRIEATLDALLAREWPRLACDALAHVRELGAAS